MSTKINTAHKVVQKCSVLSMFEFLIPVSYFLFPLAGFARTAYS